MNDPSASSSASAEPHDDNVVRLSVLEVLRELLKEGKNDAALDLVAKLVARNADLEKRLAQLNDKQKRGEGVSTAQLSPISESAQSRSGQGHRRREQTVE